jgi:hypothetical protein
LKLPEDATEELKHVGVNIIERENTMIYICALIGWNRNRPQEYNAVLIGNYVLMC